MAKAPAPAPEPTNVPDPNPNPDAALITGLPTVEPTAPASDPPKPAAKPAASKDDGLVEVKIGDATHKVPKDTAALIQAQQDAFRREFANYTAANKPAEPAPKPAPDAGPDWEGMLLDDPKKFVAESHKQIREDIMREVQETTTGQNQITQFWTGFYTENDDLKGHEGLVESVLDRNQPALQMPGMTVGEASDKLADLARREIMSLVKKFGGKPEPTPGDRTTVEGGSAPGQPAPAPEPEPAGNEQVVHLGDVIRNRRKARREGKQGTA